MPQISSPPGPENKLPTTIKALIFYRVCQENGIFQTTSHQRYVSFKYIQTFSHPQMYCKFTSIGRQLSDD